MRFDGVIERWAGVPVREIPEKFYRKFASVVARRGHWAGCPVSSHSRTGQRISGLRRAMASELSLTVLEAVSLALEAVGDGGLFSTLGLTADVRRITGREVTDGTVMRLARRLRNQGEFDFVCVSRRRAEYRRV